MRFPLRLLVSCLLAAASASLARAQESGGGTGSSSAGGSSGGSTGGSKGSGSTGSSGGSGTGSSAGRMLSDSPFSDSGASSAFGTPAKPSSGEMKPAFRTGPRGASTPDTTPGGTPSDTGTGTGTTPAGPASTFGGPGTAEAPRAQSAPTTFTVPGFFGQGTQQFTAGEGRLARPRFRFTGTVAVGYDDNVFQTPDNPQSVPDQKVQVLVSPGTPDTTETVAVPSGDPLVPNGTRTVVVPGSKPKFRTETIPGVPAPEKIGSLITRTDLAWDLQFASRRTLFTFDLNVGVDYYWDRPGRKADYNGNLSLIYLRKLTGRAQFTASANVSYQDSQPNFAQVNAPTTNNQGAYIFGNAKMDLSYRLTPRFSSVTTVTYNTTLYQEQSQESNNYGQTTFGTELRYLFSPRLTLLGDLRYSSTLHNENTDQDVDTYFLLGGFELSLSRRFTATLRIGETLQTFKESGQSSSSPYLEAVLTYQLARGTVLRWNARYGFEQTSIADSTVTVARSGLVLSQVFTPRLQGSLALYAIRSETSQDNVVVATGQPSDSGDAPQTETTSIDTVQNTIDASLSFQYALSRRWALTLNYNYTVVWGEPESQDYNRQRVFLGAEYRF